MRKYIAFIFVSIFVTFPSISLADEANYAVIYRVYHSLEGKDSNSTKRIEYDGAFAEGDLGQFAKFCSPASNWHCITTSTFDFSAPKINDSVNEWVFNGWSFRLEEKIEIELLGSSTQAYKITAENAGGRKRIFFYSFKDGLLGFSSSVVNGLSAIWWTTTAHGYGWKGYVKHLNPRAFLTDIQKEILFTQDSSLNKRMECLHNNHCQ